MAHKRGSAGADDRGFTLVELMVVVFIIGILVSVAWPVYNKVTAKVKERVCFSNQRVIEGAVEQWSVAGDGEFSYAALAGVITEGHPLVHNHIIQASACPSAPAAADPHNPTRETGAYVLNEVGALDACTFGNPVHGHY